MMPRHPKEGGSLHRYCLGKKSTKDVKSQLPRVLRRWDQGPSHAASEGQMTRGAGSCITHPSPVRAALLLDLTNTRALLPAVRN